MPIKQSSTIKEDRRSKRVSGRRAAGPSEAEWKQPCVHARARGGGGGVSAVLV